MNTHRFTEKQKEEQKALINELYDRFYSPNAIQRIIGQMNKAQEESFEDHEKHRVDGPDATRINSIH
jgi:hypothetical protein